MIGQLIRTSKRLLLWLFPSRETQKSQAIIRVSVYSSVAPSVIEQPSFADIVSGRRLLCVPYCERHNLPLKNFDCPACIDEARTRMNDALRVMGYIERHGQSAPALVSSGAEVVR